MKKIFGYIAVFIICILLSAGTCILVIHFYPKSVKKVTNISKLEKEVTITDSGISESVNKIYDATVVVITSKDNKIVGSGSGFVYKKDNNKAYIITNNHVVSVGNGYNVKLSNEEVVSATLVGSDQLADIAVLCIDASKVLKVATLGDTAKMNVGDTVFAVGAPLDYETYSFSVARGILSGKDRAVEVSLNNSYSADWVMKVLQTDTAINSGNSGGPLCNANGEVIGVTNMKLAKTGVEGMGFAIAIEDAKTSADNIVAGTKKEYPYIGISISNGSYASYLFGNGSSGEVTISKIDEKGSAYKAGLKENDIIVKVDNQKITSVATLRYYLYQHNIGDTVKLEIKRDGETKKIDMKLIK